MTNARETRTETAPRTQPEVAARAQPRSDWISEREACRMLAGIGVGRHQARRALQLGLAGPQRDVGTVRAVERAEVQALCERRNVVVEDLLRRSPAGFLLSRASDFHTPGLDSAEPVALSAGPLWRLPAIQSVVIHFAIKRLGRLPLIETVAGFVTSGYDVVNCDVPSPGGMDVPGQTSSFQLRIPSDWWDLVVGRRLPAGAGNSVLFVQGTNNGGTPVGYHRR